MKSQFILFLILLIMIFSNAELNAQTMPPLESGVSQALAKWRAANYSDVRYKLNLTLEKMSPTLEGTIEINVKCKMENEKLDDIPIILDWRKIKGHENLSTISMLN